MGKSQLSVYTRCGQMVHSNFVNLWLSSGDETDFFGVKDEKNYALWFWNEKKSDEEGFELAI
jgi:hypothetical protein